MSLLIQSAMIFFGTLMAAALVALGEPHAAAMLAKTDAGGVLLVLEDVRPDDTVAPPRR